MEALKALARLWPVHLIMLATGILAQLIGVRAIPIGVGTILPLLLLSVFLFTFVSNPNVIPPIGRVLSCRRVAAASPLIVIAIMPFIAEFGTTSGAATAEVIMAAPALLLQELGNLGTILLAFPLAIGVFRMGRDSIGAVHSIAREPNIAVIADRYGLRSPEGTGVTS